MASAFVDRCVHYRGAATTCRAGVDLAAVRDHEGRLPCVDVRGVHGEVDCDERVAPARSADPVAGPMQRALEAFGQSGCLQCGARVEREFTVGRNVMAAPCGHRIGRAR